MGNRLCHKQTVDICGFAFFIFMTAMTSPCFPQCEFGWKSEPAMSVLNGTVYAATIWGPNTVEPQPKMLVVAGQFTLAGSTTVNRIAAWDGNSWQPLGSGVGNTVRALTVYNGDLIAAGEFTTAGGSTRYRIAKWDGTAWQGL